jgi:site-specific recombinase XerD
VTSSAPGPPPGARWEATHAAYVAQLALAPLSPESRRTYASKVRQYLAWLRATDLAADPLTDVPARDRAVRQWREHLVTNTGQAPATVNIALAAVDDFYLRRGMGRTGTKRAYVPPTRPQPLDRPAQLRWLRAVQACPSARDRALASIPFYAGGRIAEVIRVDVGDLDVAEPQGILTIRGHGRGRDRVREVPIHPRLRIDLDLWLSDRHTWPGADTNPALFLNHRGGRLSVRGARDVIAGIADAAGLGAVATAQVLRQTFAATLVSGGTDQVIVAELLGHVRLDALRVYARTTADSRVKALDLLPSTAEDANPGQGGQRWLTSPRGRWPARRFW